MHAHPSFSHPARQQGAVLLVAVLLLLLAGVMTVFAMNVGLFEQRSTGNDMRAKAVNEVAEAGLAQGFEYLMRQNRDMLDDADEWVRCTATDVTFPCGAVSAALIDTNGDGTADTARRATMYKLKATSDSRPTAHTITGLDSALANFMLPLAASSKIDTAANGATVAYGVAPVVCFMQRPATSAANQPIQCGAPGASGVTDLKAVTFVSVAKIPGESASQTLVQTLGEYPTLNDPMGKPPITASGSAGVTGNLQIVTNPNAGGPGVPVSVWNRLDITKTGTTNTCYADEFFRYTSGSANPTPYQGTIRCDNCRCDASGAPASLSYDNSGNLQAEGIDILDVEGNSTQRGTGTNYNIRSDQYSYPTCEFPPDLFRFVFGVRAWNDTNNDCFGETKLANVVYQNPDTGAVGSVGPDEAHLYANADKIIPADPTNPSPLIRASQLGTAALLSSPATSGLVWCQANCNIGSNTQVGTPSGPVILVLDGQTRIQGTVFGMVFIRETGASMNATTGSGGTGSCPDNCILQMNAGANIYGALVLQGQMKVNGTSAVIHDATVLRTIAENEGTTPATLPGAWNDQRSY